MHCFLPRLSHKNPLLHHDSGLTKPLLAIAAAIAIAGGLIGTGNAQQGIGAAGMGIIAEKPEKFGQVLFFFVIPETLWIIGFVLGIILLLGIYCNRRMDNKSEPGHIHPRD